ncbi:MAG: MBL fold metallo-hydrolase [Betaproteobacteria bacterium]|nr:MBL fold metallo-hydrolase [Betaproteobacteria bacterium]
MLPRLVMLGYKGPIHTTAATIDLLQVMLLDSAHIQEKEAEWQLRNRHRRAASARGAQPPLYTVTQAMETLKRLRPVTYGETFVPHPDVCVCFHDAGHILGSAIIEVSVGGRKIVFSGDLGQPGRPVMNDPTPIAEADVLVVESTYGNRQHRSLQETESELLSALRRTLTEGCGNVIIPAFAVGRTQELIYVLAGLVRAGRLAPMRLYVDSPMASAATRITLNLSRCWMRRRDRRIEWLRWNPRQLDVRPIADVEESMVQQRYPAGGRGLFRQRHVRGGRIWPITCSTILPRPECAVLITGFQAADAWATAGRWRPFSPDFRASRTGQASLHTIGGLSAHADRAALLGWLRNFRRPPERNTLFKAILRSGYPCCSSSGTAGVAQCRSSCPPR